MPKTYPVEVRLFALQKKKEGHTWDKVAEMVKQNFGLDPPPSKRQMTKWSGGASMPKAAIAELNHRLPKYAPEWLSVHQDELMRMFAEVLAEAVRGRDFRVPMAKSFLWLTKEILGSEPLRVAWAEFTQEEERLQQGSNAISDKARTPFTEREAKEVE
jgi:hypothetical protein